MAWVEATEVDILVTCWGGGYRGRHPGGVAGVEGMEADILVRGWGRGYQAGHPLAGSLPYTVHTEQVSMEDCCTDGNQMANQHRDCSLQYTSESKECRYVRHMSRVWMVGPASLPLLLLPLCSEPCIRSLARPGLPCAHWSICCSPCKVR